MGDERFRGRISIPYLSPSGLVTMRFRRFPDEGDAPKYLSPYSDQARLFNAAVIVDRDDDFICITEGEFDCIVATMIGLPAVGAPGTNSWEPWFARAFRGYRTVYVLADGDKAGDELAKTVSKTVENVSICKMPDGHDVSSFYLEVGSDGIWSYIGE